MRGETYAHEQIAVPPGRSAEFLDLVREQALPAYEKYGWELAGAWETAMVDDSECFLLWAIPSWEHWAEFEKAQRGDGPIVAFRQQARQVATSFYRFLLVDSPLSPMRTGRQPRREDRTGWEE